MGSYVVFTESTGDLTPALIEEAGLRVLPMSFNLGGRPYLNWPDGREISSRDFYDKLRGGAVCTTSKNDVDYIVTEYGIAHLRGKSLAERTRQLIGIAHPDFREDLIRAAERNGIWKNTSKCAF